MMKGRKKWHKANQPKSELNREERQSYDLNIKNEHRC